MATQVHEARQESNSARRSTYLRRKRQARQHARGLRRRTPIGRVAGAVKVSAMSEPFKGPPVLEECWEGFLHLLCVIDVLFGEYFDLARCMSRRNALRALPYLRDAECAARALLLAWAQTLRVVLAPLRARLRKTSSCPHKASIARFALLTPVRRPSRVRAIVTTSPRLAAARAEQRQEDAYAKSVFGRHPVAARAALADAPPFWRDDAERGALRTVARTADLPGDFIDGCSLVRRFNGHIVMSRDPARCARRLGLRLARDRDKTTVRALARPRIAIDGRAPPMDGFVRECQALAHAEPPPRGADDG